MDRTHRVGQPVKLRQDILTDLLNDNLDIVFCGTAASSASAQARAYYAHPQNKFWTILFDTGLTPVKLRPEQFPALTEYRIGLTDFIKSHSGMDHQIPIARQREAARARLRAVIELYKPHHFAFTSKKAGAAFLGGGRQFGKQNEMIGSTKFWVLPSTSGAANGSWRPEIWHDFVKEIRAA